MTPTPPCETPFEWARGKRAEDPKKWYEEMKIRSKYYVEVDPRDEDPEDPPEPDTSVLSDQNWT